MSAFILCVFNLYIPFYRHICHLNHPHFSGSVSTVDIKISDFVNKRKSTFLGVCKMHTILLFGYADFELLKFTGILLWNATGATPTGDFCYYCCFRVKSAASFITYKTKEALIRGVYISARYLWWQSYIVWSENKPKQEEFRQINLFKEAELSNSYGRKPTAGVVNLWDLSSRDCDCARRSADKSRRLNNNKTESLRLRINLWLLRWSCCFCAFSRRWLWQTTRWFGKKKIYFRPRNTMN